MIYRYWFVLLLVLCTVNIQSEIRSLDTLMSVNINGENQKILIQTDNISNPVLLYIHGGPGASIMMLSHCYSDSLRKYFTFVNWDQRGAGLSYRRGMDSTKITEKQIERDALAVTKFLSGYLKQPKIFILGHSFGSIIGLRLAHNFPQHYYAYIGVGQVLNWNKSVKQTYEWQLKEVTKAKDYKNLEILQKTGQPTFDIVQKYRGHLYNPVNFDSLSKLSPYYFEGYLEKSNEARNFTQRNISINPCPDCERLPLDEIKEIKIPVYFFEGRHDHVIACSPALVHEFCTTLKAPEKRIFWFENSAHLPNLEETEKFQTSLIEILKKHL